MGVIGMFLGLGRGALVAMAVMVGFALLKKLIIAFGFLLALIKFGILIIFLALFISIAIAIIRGWSESKNGVKST
jgi:hypothetical protein